MHLQVYGGEEKGGNTRAHSMHLQVYGGKPTYKVGCSLCTCKCMEERRKGETHARSLASPHRAGPRQGGAWRGEARRWARE
jgi:hypothetical protein